MPRSKTPFPPAPCAPEGRGYDDGGGTTANHGRASEPWMSLHRRLHQHSLGVHPRPRHHSLCHESGGPSPSRWLLTQSPVCPRNAEQIAARPGHNTDKTPAKDGAVTSRCFDAQRWATARTISLASRTHIVAHSPRRAGGAIRDFIPLSIHMPCTIKTLCTEKSNAPASVLSTMAQRTSRPGHPRRASRSHPRRQGPALAKIIVGKRA